MKADLHLHSTASDGGSTPAELLQLAADIGLTHLAITDHDTITGSNEAAALLADRPDGPVLLRGMELSMQSGFPLHLLAYGTRMTSELETVMAELREGRRARAVRMLARLDSLGCPLDAEAIMAASPDYIGSPQLADALLEAGHVRTRQEAFTRFVGRGAPAWEAPVRLNIRDALALLNRSGFLPVMAHPYETGLPPHQLDALLAEWAPLGLRGLEVYHPSAMYADRGPLLSMAARYGLLVTGGSDFHRNRDGKHGEIACMVPYWTTMQEDMERLLASAAQA